MARTTVDIDSTVLSDLKRLSEETRKPLGRLISELLARALAEPPEPAGGPAFQWSRKRMGTPLVDIDDKDALWSVLDGPE